MRLWLFFAGLNGLIAVAAGAYGWHWLQVDEGPRQIFMMGVDYQMWHALALLGVAWLADRRHRGRSFTLSLAGTTFTLGILLFSGTLYVFGATGAILVPYAAPTGGFLLVFGWLMVLLGAFQRD
ncbi:MAG: DUF423 domain-containing protein [Rhodospirillales bacterium]|nr:DUF423 domain-containing protein [Rhodospirillales bacterium]